MDTSYCPSPWRHRTQAECPEGLFLKSSEQIPSGKHRGRACAGASPEPRCDANLSCSVELLVRLPLNPPTTGQEGHGDEQPSWLQNFLPFLWLSCVLVLGSNQDHKTKPPRENFHQKLQRRSVFAGTRAKGGVQTSGEEQSMMGRLVRCPRWPQPCSALLPTQTLPPSASRTPVGSSSWAPRGYFSLTAGCRRSTASRQVVHDRRIRDMLCCGKKTQGHPG